MNILKMTLLAAMVAPAVSMAATDGPLSVISTDATMEVTVAVEPVISIKHVDDVNFGTFAPGINISSGDRIQKSETMCVYTNAVSYDITFNSMNGAGPSFQMLGDEGDRLTYNISLTNVVNSVGTYSDNLVDPTVDNSNSYGPFVYADSYTGDSCVDSGDSSTVDNIKLDFELLGDDVIGMTPDYYSDTITITARVNGLPMPD